MPKPPHPPTPTLLLAAVLLLAGTAAHAAKDPRKDTFLQPSAGVKLAAYHGAVVVLEPTAIDADKDKPAANDEVRTLSDQLLLSALQESGLFSALVSVVPADLPAEVPALRATTHLSLEHGSQALRALVGFGAGKSRLYIQVDFADAHTGQPVAHFNGYGVGGGYMTLWGGDVASLAAEDLEDNYGELTELFQEQIEGE